MAREFTRDITGNITARAAAEIGYQAYAAYQVNRQIGKDPLSRQTRKVRKKAGKEILYNTFKKGADSYVDDEGFRWFVEKAGRTFRFGEETTSLVAGPTQEIMNYDTGEVIEFGGNEVIKKLSKFPRHAHSEEVFREFLRENDFYGCPRPGSYYSAFHEQFRSPQVLRSVNEKFKRQMHYAWQDSLCPGKSEGTWNRYDLNQAYLWASTQGLPDMRTVQASDFLGNYPGLYHIRLRPPRDPMERAHWPYPFDRLLDVNASTEEIDSLALPIDTIYGGVVWQDSLATDAITSVLNQFSFAKQASKGYWGRWASTTELTCSTASGAEWTVPNNKLNLVWAHMIVSRVRLRIWDIVKQHGAAHVYVDSVVTRGTLPTGSGLGEWKLEKHYPNGVFVGWPGGYGEDERCLDSHTGRGAQYDFDAA